MKPCPECGESMRLAAGQWLHLKPGRCRTVSLRATAEEVRQQAGAGGRASVHQPTGTDGWRFRYLTTENLGSAGND